MKFLRYMDSAGIERIVLLAYGGEIIVTMTACEFDALQPSLVV